MKKSANNRLSKGKMKFFILVLILTIPVYTNTIAQPFVSVCKNGTVASLSVHSFETGNVYQEVSSSSDAIHQGLWSTIPVIISFTLIMFFLTQFLIQIIKDRKLAKE
jgi:hypothetical protein